jgi:P4 family phage/plasmid primase-like protien
MKEAADHFYIKSFVEKLDSKPFLLGCDNGVLDFKDPNVFRPGKPDDFVSKSTRIDYVPLTEEHEGTIAEINEFMYQLFPQAELCEYMWDHMASLMIGKNVNQTFNMYTGSGRNGKSVFVDLLSQVLGEYKATVPVSIITQKRVGVGASSSEIAQLMGMRYAVMQEPSKGDKLNEGVMKELTGGDELQARQLFKESVTFAVLFKLVICCNDLMEIRSNDEGTWRRIRVCPFRSLFCEKPVQNDSYQPYQFLVDKNVHQKFKVWRTVLLAMLVERAKVKQGAVVDCNIVLEASNEYRGQQDLFSEFIKAHISRDDKGQIKQCDLQDLFITWWKRSHISNEKPPTKELFTYMIRHHYGEKIAPPGVAAYWIKIKLVEHNDEIPGAEAAE